MRVRSDSFLRFSEYLAHREDLVPAAAQPLAQELGIPYTTLIEWWRHLEFHRALLVGPGNVRVDRPRLLQVLTAHRVARLTPRVTRRIGLDAHGASRALRGAGVPHALALLSAANEWAFFEPRRNIEVYVAPHDLTQARAALPEVEDGPFEVQVFGEDPRNLPTASRGAVPVTSLFLTLLDCRAHPEGGAHANFLERNVVQWGRRP